MNTKDQDQLAAWLRQARGREFDVVIAGRIVGGKFGEAPQMPESYAATEDGFVLHFGGAYKHEVTALDGTRHTVRERGTERLEVIHSSGISIGPNGALLVETADEVRFGWHLYPEPQTPENWCVLVYRRHGDEVEYSITSPFRPRSGPPLPERFPAPDGPFVRLSP